MSKTNLILSFLFLLLSSLPNPSSPSTFSFIYGGCSQIKYDPSSSYQFNLNSLLTSLLNSANFSPYNKYTINAPNPDPTLYGVYQCRGDISTADCSSCVRSAISQIGILCLDTSGATIQLDGCYVKYDNVTFLGVQDKSLVLKKCGPSTGRYDTDMLSRRDEVLTSLGGGTGMYRVGSIGYVSGVGQCVGDLDGGECTDCVSEAVERLRGGCGWSVSGAVYLGKCYAQYVAGGAYTSSGSSGAVSSSNEGSGQPVSWGGWWGLAMWACLMNLLKYP
ncbi:plasmodesmata-located protein 7-like [Magnolia sinica]|uniref:plasmodesmata-located protein 7-like n=1 Tax=Magnolia sinica TaxID=86752 RepID=UPI002659A7DC|nr:plasmodesmata-located protein 7-like [Magnolia sinica]